jgi:cell division protein FtsB
VRDAGISAAFLLPLGILLFASVFVPLRVLESEGLPRYRALRAELREARETNERMRREVIELRARVERLQNDPEALERIARDELGMLRSDEIVFQFSD